MGVIKCVTTYAMSVACVWPSVGWGGGVDFCIDIWTVPPGRFTLIRTFSNLSNINCLTVYFHLNIIITMIKTSVTVYNAITLESKI